MHTGADCRGETTLQDGGSCPIEGRLQKPEARETFRAFNGLRFVAAFMILCYHFLSLTREFKEAPAFLQNVVSAGPIALGFFFILSGFVLAHAYAHRAPHSAAARSDFWFARVARLYPVYLLAFGLFAPMAYVKYLGHGSAHGLRTFAVGGLVNLFALQSWTAFAQSWNGPSWSLSVEAFFYFIFPFVLVRFQRLRNAPLFALVAALWLAMLTVTTLHVTEHLSAHLWSVYLQNNPLFWTPLFLAGVALYRLLPWWRGLPGAVVNAVQLLALAGLLLLCGTMSGRSADFFIMGGAAPLLALLVLAFSHSVGLQSRAFGVRGLYELGGASYVTYILQAPVWHITITLLTRLRHRAPGAAPLLSDFVLYLLIILAGSFAVQSFFEKPMQRWLQSVRAAKKRREQTTRDLPDLAIEAP